MIAVDTGRGTSLTRNLYGIYKLHKASHPAAMGCLVSRARKVSRISLWGG